MRLRGDIEICHFLAGASAVRKVYVSFFNFKASACLVEDKVFWEKLYFKKNFTFLATYSSN